MIKKILKIIKEEGVFSLMKKSNGLLTRKFFNISPNFIRIMLAKKIKNFESTNIDEVIDYSFNVIGLTFRPIQIRSEFKKMLTVFVNKKPKIILEIGTALGGSLMCFCKLASPNATIISIDLPGGEFGGGYPEWKEEIYKLFSKKDQKLTLMREDSHLPETVAKLEKILNGEKIDFIFIDGDHKYEGVKKDFEIYSPLVKKDGVVMFHDIAPNGSEQYAGGVPKFWKEIKSNYNYEEFIENKDQVGFGIGCINI